MVISSVTEAIELVNNSITDVIELNRYLTQKEHDLMTDADEEAMEESRLVRRADSALDVLNALFWNHPYFRDIEDVRQYLGEIDSLDDPKAATCRDWICDIISELDDVKITTHSAADVNILKNRLEPFITRTSDLTVPGTRLKCHAWPIVSAIQISLNARALKPGVKIFDIPGMKIIGAHVSTTNCSLGVGDTNTAHVDKARASLYGADIIIVTTRVSRVAANDNVYNQIVWALQRRGPRHVIALCTHSDEVCDTLLVIAIGTLMDI